MAVLTGLVAVVGCAVFARLLSLDLMSPAWAVVGVVGATVAATWWPARRMHRRASTTVVIATLACCALASWLAWVPEGRAFIDPHLLSVLEANGPQADADASRLSTQVDQGCLPASDLDLGVVAEAGDWASVCVWGRDPSSRSVTFEPTDEARLVLSWGAQPHRPASCVRPVEGRWWVLTQGDGGSSDRCPAGFGFTGSG